MHKQEAKGMVSPENVLIIVPAYNEQDTIKMVLSRLLDETVFRHILVIDDGSTDRTATIVQDMGVNLLKLPFNLGIGATVQAGFRYARKNGYDYVVRIDADGQHEVTHIPDLLVPLLSGKADLVIGSRALGESLYRASFPRRLGIKILSAFVSKVLGKPITDTTSGFRAANIKVISTFARSYPDDYPEVESIILLKRMGFRIEEVGIKMTPRLAGESSINAFRSAYYMVKVIFSVLIELLRKVDKQQADP